VESGHAGESSIFLSEAEDLAAVIRSTFVRPPEPIPLFLLCAVALVLFLNVSSFPTTQITSPSQCPHETASCALPSPSEICQLLVGKPGACSAQRESVTASIAVNFLETISQYRHLREISKEPLTLFSGVILGP
jgi:hypothetical protein